MTELMQPSMSTPNEYGYSTSCNRKIKKLLKEYKPKDVSEITALRNKQTLWHLNTVRKMPIRGQQEELTTEQSVNVCLTILVVITVITILFNL